MPWAFLVASSRDNSSWLSISSATVRLMSKEVATLAISEACFKSWAKALVEMNSTTLRTKERIMLR